MNRSKRRLMKIRDEIEDILGELSDRGYTSLELYSEEDFYLGHGRFSKYVVKVRMRGDTLKRPYVLKVIELDTQSSGSLSSLKEKSKNEIDKLKKYWERVRICMKRGNLVNVIGIYDVEFEDTGESYGLVLMEYCSENLRSLMEKEVSEEEKIEVIKGVLEGLKCLNERRIIYTDLKPENILIKGGRGIIGDLEGISSLSTKSVGQVTEKYASPELLKGEIGKVDEKSLMWSIGVMMYEVFEGIDMYEGYDNRWERKKEVEEGKLEFSKSSERIRKIIKGLLRKRDNRIGSIDELEGLLEGKEEIKEVKEEKEEKKPRIEIIIDNSAKDRGAPDFLGMEWIWVEGGCFEMGCGDWDGDCWSYEKSVHEVCVDGFWMGKYLVTFDQYDRFCEETGRKKPLDKGWGRGSRPVICVNWYDAKDFCEWYGDKVGRLVRLPTEAEWEYAARSRGRKVKYATKTGELNHDLANYDGVVGKTTPVGKYPPNPLGLYDMSGNVWEWCEDVWSADAYKEHGRHNPIYRGEGSLRVWRGGSWYNDARDLRCSFRDFDRATFRDYDVGFRILCK